MMARLIPGTRFHWPVYVLLWLAVSFQIVVAQDAAKSRSFNSDGVKIHYTIEGSGSSVVLIHGLYSSADINWRLPGTIKALSDHYQVIALDVRGHGQSDKPEKEELYGVQLAEDVIRLLDHLKIEKAHVVGYSMGGMIAMKVVVTHPDRVSSAVLGGMGWLREGSWQQSFWERMPERDSSKALVACCRSLANLAITEPELQAVKVPVSIIVGDRDPVKKMYVIPLKRIRNDWPVVEIQEAGHINCILKPQFKDELVKALDPQNK